MLKRLKAAHHKAVSSRADQFVFDGHDFIRDTPNT